MASGCNLSVWLECIGVVSGCCCKEVCTYIDLLIISLIPIPLVLYSSFFCSSIPTSLLILKLFFSSLYIYMCVCVLPKPCPIGKYGR